MHLDPDDRILALIEFGRAAENVGGNIKFLDAGGLPVKAALAKVLEKGR